MKKQTMKTINTPGDSNHTGRSAFMAIIASLALVVPVAILPGILDNAFEKPKSLLILLGACALAGLYASRWFTGRRLMKSDTHTPKIILLLFALNLFSLFQTQNMYFTRVAATLNIACLVILYFVSVYADEKWISRIILAASTGGLLVALVTILQSYGIFLFFPWLNPGDIAPGTIGNSNYLGAYLIFPFYTALGLVFMAKGPARLFSLAMFIIIAIGVIFSRARASWVHMALSLPFFLYLIARVKNAEPLRFFKKNMKEIGAGCVLLFITGAIFWTLAPKHIQSLISIQKVTEPETLRLRYQKYIPPAVWLFKQNPLFGAGLWSYRNRVYEAQAQLNKADPSFFTNYDNPKPRRAHNDYVEILAESGLTGALALLLLLVMVLRHGWKSIHDKNLPESDRLVTAMAFSSILAVLLAAFFFFPFRLNITMLMAVVMMGIIEAVYNRHYGLVSKAEIRPFRNGRAFLLITLLLLAGVIWNMGLKPIMAEQAYHRFKQDMKERKAGDAQKQILKALAYDPLYTPYAFQAGQFSLNVLQDPVKADAYIEQAINDFNGDLTFWSLFYFKGLIKFRIGSLLEARSAFEQSLYYWPDFEPARQKLAEVNDIIEKHDRVMIKLR